MATIESQKTEPTRRHTYGVPRVFDIYLLLVVTSAFAVLFTGLSLLGNGRSSGQLTAYIGLYTVGIGLAQSLMFRGSRPREASFIAGVLLAIATGAMIFDRPFWTPNFLGYLTTASIIGLQLGYAAGVLIAGVFLIADVIRRRFSSSAPSNARDVPFDKIH